MTKGSARNVVRALVALSLIGALASFALAPVPKELPTVALGQSGLYRLEVALLGFYGCLALITPALSALIWGRLPIEISTRGARFAGEADRTAKRDEATIKELEQSTKRLREGSTTANFKIRQLEKQIVVTRHD
ncbi:MAG TPA: hypothetical protein VFY75_04310 [Solirubrobacterales bacterium]|nr:hypothetical protein [Solirubrobacterales bacterium]